MTNRFQKGSGCFKCEECGKLTRVVDMNLPYCPKCIKKMEDENSKG